jgi:hypothetical protein
LVDENKVKGYRGGESHLFRQIELIQPESRRDARQLCDESSSRASRSASSRVHGRRAGGDLGGSTVVPLPESSTRPPALYTPADARGAADRLRRLPELLGRRLAPAAPPPVPVRPAEPFVAPEPVQLGLF